MAMIETQRTPLYNQLTDATRQDAPRLTLYGEVASARVADSGAPEALWTPRIACVTPTS